MDAQTIKIHAPQSYYWKTSGAENSPLLKKKALILPLDPSLLCESERPDQQG